MFCFNRINKYFDIWINYDEYDIKVTCIQADKAIIVWAKLGRLSNCIQNLM